VSKVLGGTLGFCAVLSTVLSALLLYNRAYELEEIFVTSLAEILILRGAVPIEALDRMTGDPARDEQWINELIDNDQVSPSQVAQARAVYAKLPFIELLEYPVDVNAVALVPASMCRRHEVLPVYMLGEQLTLAMVDPNNVFALDDVRATTGLRVSVVVAEKTDLAAAIDRYHRADDEMSSLTQVFEEETESTGTDLAPYGGGPRGRRSDRALREPAHLAGDPGCGLRHPHRAR
jgi:type IV pilus assembly protein PilB